MKLLAAVISGIAAVSFSSLAAAQAMPADKAGADADAHSQAKVKKDRKRTNADASTNASVGASSPSANTGANGRDNTNASSPSRNSGMPGHMSQGSVHNDEGKK